MKRKFLPKSLALLALLMCALMAQAYDFTDYGYEMYFNYLDDGSVEVTFYDDDYNSYSGNVTIPSVATRGAINQTTFPVTRIGQYAFRECSNLTGVTIPSSITSIGSSAFCICAKLTMVWIPNSVKRIEWNAFGDCNNLSTVYIGSGVTSIAAYGFDSPLTSVYCYATTPPTIANQNAFKSSTYSNATLYVPADSYYLYKNATYWSNFANITRLPSSSAIDINSTNFPDASFRSYLLSLYPKGFLNSTDINDCTSLNVSYKGISNLKGIEYFTNLKELRCYSNYITSLDVSHNTKLTYLDCDANGMTSLNVSNTKLTYLDCGPNNLTSITGLPTTLETLYCNGNKFTTFSCSARSSLKKINISNCTSLTTLYCYNNNLTSLDVSGNTAMTYLDCAPNYNLTSITGLGDCTALQSLYCYQTSISDLSVLNSLSNLTTVSCHDTKITSLNLSNMPKLAILNCYSNPLLQTAVISYNNELTTLNIQQCPALTRLECTRNHKLPTFDITGNTAMTYLDCSINNSLSSFLGYTSCKALQYLYCYDTKVSNLSEISQLSNLVQLSCMNTNITSLDASWMPKLKSLYCYECPYLTDIEFINCKELSLVYCRNNPVLKTLYVSCEDVPNSQLASVDVTGSTALERLIVTSSPLLTSITGVTSCILLKELSCGECGFKNLGFLSSFPNLTILSCNKNNLNSLDVTNNKNLKNLDCSYNLYMTTITGLNNCTQLSTFDCSHCSLTSLNGLTNLYNLEYLYCNNNKLAVLSVSGKSKLKRLECNDNLLTSLNVQGCSQLWLIYCYKNKISGSGMSTLVNSLPRRQSSSNTYFYAMYFTNEYNTMTSAQITTACNMNWIPMRYNGTTWVSMQASIVGDVNGDNAVNMLDLTALIELLLTGNESGNSGTDVNQDGNTNMLDLTALIELLLTN